MWWKNLERWVKGSKLVHDEPKTDARIIAIIGPTGSGKTTFINTVTGAKNEVGYRLQTCTKKIEITPYSVRSDLNIVFVDTPGIDEQIGLSESKILDMLSKWLKKTKHVQLSGIFYLHRISDNRSNEHRSTLLANLNLFEELVGKNSLRKVILVTTMWNNAREDESRKMAREIELKEKYWNTMIIKGSRVVRFHRNKESGGEIIDDFLKPGNEGGR